LRAGAATFGQSVSANEFIAAASGSGSRSVLGVTTTRAAGFGSDKRRRRKSNMTRG